MGLTRTSFIGRPSSLPDDQTHRTLPEREASTPPTATRPADQTSPRRFEDRDVADRFDRRIRAFQTSPESVQETHFLVDYRFAPETGFSLEESTFRTLLITSQRTLRPLKYEAGHGRGLVEGTIEDVGGYIPIQQNPSGSGLVTIALPIHLCTES